MARDWQGSRDEALYQELCAGGATGLCGRLRAIGARFYAPPPQLLCPEPGEPFWGFPAPPEGVALTACEGCGVELDIEQVRAVRDWCAREHKRAALHWVAHRQKCIQQGWHCARQEAALGLDRLAGGPAPRATPSMQPFLAGAILGALAGRITKVA